MADINSFREKLQSLIAKFEKDKAHYVSKGYPEAQVRLDFLNPFFKALGWDIENKAQKPPHERDVIVELSPEATGRPDYNFRINGATKFFVEAKAPSVALDDINHILQAKSYAWSTKEVYFVVLTDFEEFRLYDASLKPNPKFPDEGLILGLKHTDYLNNIEKLWELSKERIEQGSLEALLPKDTKSKRLRIPPDKSFLEDLTEWRTELAKDIHKRNPEFDVKLLNDVVQKLLDRIIFIRIAEDRRIRPDKELMEIVALWKEEGKRKSIMSHLLDLFHEVNDDLNGDIFKPHACERADVDSNLIAEIIENLYFPKSRYRFDAIGVELLGSIYERYLGSTIRVTPQRVKVEEKPEVRKAGGVYYTPKYIVDYIVRNTVGKLIEGKTPKQIEKIKILDPACGSGSFLLGAYQYLLDYHLEYYRKHTKEAQTQFFDFYHKVGPEDLALPLRTKAMILRNNIFGVDIDPQAVEITMMSLYLKALEGERSLLPKKQHLLPSLGNNIKCGNSLIGYDILDQGNLFDDETKSRINPFDWNSKSVGFGEIMANGGFDVVIGNPPYFNINILDKNIFHYLESKYSEIHTGYNDIMYYFVYKGINLLNKNGVCGVITSNYYLGNSYARLLRKFLKAHVSKIINFKDYLVFEDANVHTNIIIANKNPRSNEIIFFEKNDKQKLNPIALESNLNSFTLSRKDLSEDWVIAEDRSLNLIEKIGKKKTPLGDIAIIEQGSKSGKNEVFTVSHEFANENKFEKDILRKNIKNSDIDRYNKKARHDYLIYVDNDTDIKKYPNIYGYLSNHKKTLSERNEVKMGLYSWFRFDRPRRKEIFDSPEKLIVPYRAEYNRFAYDNEQYFNDGGDIRAIVLKQGSSLSIKYILGILNSKLMNWYYGFIGKPKGKSREYFNEPMSKIPIRPIDFNNLTEKAIHDKLVSLVDRMLDLHKKKNSLPPSAEREKTEREITITDEKVDEIVYGLYGITEGEKKIIEKA
ncbi:MAG: N-6 DNA methylase [Nitrospirota bacterium]|nr:N-6 DNA methylase [Nitrospirota bacterium]